ncbi:LysR substrate-binding domain-containing protein [Streptomyces sp. NPDC048248]|uniref:LysR substrate-binding domain-containing protein n=1 Tax=Streptomyces sp. NPDC048248 TaxID=3365523 RepID=UPI00371106ED
MLRVGFSAPWCGDLIVRVAEGFHARHPRGTVEIQEVTFTAAFTALRGDDLDLLVIELPVDGSDVAVGPLLFSERRVDLAVIEPLRLIGATSRNAAGREAPLERSAMARPTPALLNELR